MKVLKSILLFMVIICLILPMIAFANNQVVPAESPLFDAAVSNSLEGNSSYIYNIKFLTDIDFTVGDSTSVPTIYNDANKYGFYVSNAISSAKEFQSVIINFDKSKMGDGNTVLVEARGSKDEQKWSEWKQAGDQKDEIKFYDAYKFLEYRITLIDYNAVSLPVISGLSLKFRSLNADEKKAFSEKTVCNVNTIKAAGKPTIDSSSLKEMSQANNIVSPQTATNPYTDTCFATQEGCQGLTTANGHYISDSPTDIFVALPSHICLNSSDSDRTFTVNVTYNGITAYNVPVWDVGPYNENDDYWNVNYNSIPYPPYQVAVRDTWGYAGYGDISRGTAEEWSAFNSNFMNGWSSSHVIQGLKHAYVSNSNPGTQVNNSLANPNYPTNNLRNNGAEIDLSDTLHNSVLKIPNMQNAYVTVKFNWVEN